MSLSCRSCLTRSHKDYYSLLSIFPEFGNKSVLDVLNMVTSSEISYSETLPREICMTCYKNLKVAYSFIILFKNSQVFLQKSTTKLPRECTDKFLDTDNAEEIVIVDDDGSTYVNMIQEIFGCDSTEDKKENLQKKPEKIISVKSGRHQKIVLMSVDDVLKQKQPPKLIPKPYGGDIPKSSGEDNEEKEDEIPLKKENEVYLKEEKNVYFIEEEEADDLYRDNNEDKNFSCEDQEVHSNENSGEEDEELQQDILEMQKNRKRNINNIQIVTIEDVLDTDKRKRGEKKVMSVDDVIKMKPRKRRSDIKNDGQMSCDICERNFDGRQKLLLHKLRLHHPNWEEKFKCHICGLQCRTMSAHKHHMGKHSDKRYSCNQCEKSYVTRSKMKEHILRVHEKKYENKYLCTKCGKGFKFSNALEYHMNKHNNSKNYVCGYCGFACLALSALKRHERTHTGERPYECKHCHKTFAGAPEKQKHEFGHEGVFRYHCKYCDRKFIQTYNMKVHWLQHKGPYVCEICKRNFADAEILKFHYSHSHKIKDVVIEDSDVKSADELLEDEDGDYIVE